MVYVQLFSKVRKPIRNVIPERRNQLTVVRAFSKKTKICRRSHVDKKEQQTEHADRTCRQSHEDKKEQQTEHADNPTWTKKNSRQNMQTIPRRQKRAADRTLLSRQAQLEYCIDMHGSNGTYANTCGTCM